ncbi:MAG: hypothetical protein V4717_07980 [Bacteroidota bacterium]
MLNQLLKVGNIMQVQCLRFQLLVKPWRTDLAQHQQWHFAAVVGVELRLFVMASLITCLLRPFSARLAIMQVLKLCCILLVKPCCAASAQHQHWRAAAVVGVEPRLCAMASPTTLELEASLCKNLLLGSFLVHLIGEARAV